MPGQVFFQKTALLFCQPEKNMAGTNTLAYSFPISYNVSKWASLSVASIFSKDCFTILLFCQSEKMWRGQTV